MKRAMCAILFLASACFGQTARDYYNELYKAGGLDRWADEYVCFADEGDNQNFFILTQSEDIRKYLMADGSFGKLPKEIQGKMQKDFLIVRGYNKGIAFADKQIFDKDRNSWVSDKVVMKNMPLRMRITITWETMRYKREVEVLNADSTVKAALPGYGKCEEIPSTVHQKGN
jgi:hypothetical protein